MKISNAVYLKILFILHLIINIIGFNSYKVSQTENKHQNINLFHRMTSLGLKKAEIKRLSIQIIYDPLCDLTMNFFSGNISRMIQNGIHEFIDLSLYPGEFASYKRISSKFINIQCNNGLSECMANLYHICLIKQLKDNNKALKIISDYFIELRSYLNRNPIKIKEVPDSVHYKFIKYALEDNKMLTFKGDNLMEILKDCVESYEGKNYFAKSLDSIKSYKAAAKLNPYIVVDSVALKDQNQKDFVNNPSSYICKLLNYSNKVPICLSYKLFDVEEKLRSDNQSSLEQTKVQQNSKEQSLDDKNNTQTVKEENISNSDNKSLKSNSNSNDTLNEFKIVYDSLCDPVINFFTTSFKMFKQNKIDKEVKILLYPGAFMSYQILNEKTPNKKTNFFCQNGDNECEFNILNVCLLNIIYETSKLFDLIICLFEQIRNAKKQFKPMNSMIFANECLQKTDLIIFTNQIKTCIEKTGQEMMISMIQRIKDLKETPTLIPWIFVNNKRSIKTEQDIISNMSLYSCKLTNFSEKIKICNSYQRFSLEDPL